jgi:hypothetical protein
MKQHKKNVLDDIETTIDTINKLKEQSISEKMVLSSWYDYSKIVAEKYKEAPEYDASATKYWNALKQSNDKLFKRLLSRTKIILVSEDSSNKDKVLNLLGTEYPVKTVNGDPYENQKEMKLDWQNTRSVMISIDHSDHPVFSVEENVIFRSVHDFIVHILGNHPFGNKGEIAAYNLHAKLAPPNALPALFTEVVGQASYAVVYGSFPVQKIAVLDGFDYINIGNVHGYTIKSKKLIKKDNNEQ